MVRDRPKSKRQVSYFKWAALILAVLLIFDIATFFGAEGLWFQDVNYLSVFWLRLRTQISLGLFFFLTSLAVLGGNLWLTQRWAYLKVEGDRRSRRGIGLRWLLLISFVLGLLIAIQLLYQAQIVASYWQPSNTVYNRSLPIPLWIKPGAVQALFNQLTALPWQVALLVVIAIGFVVFPQILSAIAAVLMSLGFSLVLSGQWLKVLSAFRPTLFAQRDPLFQRDISFYIFRLPVAELLEFWLTGLLFFALIAVTLIYLLSGESLSQGRFYRFSPSQQRHIYGLAGSLLLATSFGHWLTRYQLLYSTQGVTYGASYTSVHVNLPVNTGLSLIALALALVMLWRTLFWSVSVGSLLEWFTELGHHQYAYLPPISKHPPTLKLLYWGLGLYSLLVLLGGILAPMVVQRLVVQPNELVRERPYIERSIALTRSAFDLDNIQVEPFNPDDSLTLQDLQQNSRTINNIRVWDTRPLLESNRQLQQIRLYYEFLDADVDRYSLIQDDGTTDRRQVLISARELNYDQVPAEAKTWVNQHLIYTHGYGFTMSPVNTAAASGLPDYFIQDIAHVPSSEVIRRSIPVGEPRLYFGELTDTYVMTRTRVEELDYPSGSDNVYNIYDGRAGIQIGSRLRRLLFAKHLSDWQMIFTANFTPDTRLLFRRNINERVRTIAPFLRYDADPYLVVADVEPAGLDTPPTAAATDEPNYLYWIIDAYTTSDRYPYSDPGDYDFNYIRNSVKVVIDAYHGSVNFYVADASDPIIQTWSKIFPSMFQSLDDMPPALREHIRYPQDFYQVQSDQLMTYHMTDPQVFYNREDQWRAPNEIYANEPQTVEPYYLIMRLPAQESAEFILLRPFTPAQRNNLVAWLAASSDGDRYGRMLLYRFPKQELVFGPEQIEARINQDPEISQRISLWNTQGSRANQGNLLVIPIEQSLLYVEPLYLEAEQNRLPTLARVIVVYQNRIAMAQTLEESLGTVFGANAGQPTAPPILRELGEAPATEGITPITPSAAESAPSPEADSVPSIPAGE
ncbi:UPF0182 family protein [Almyronema epifaneia]|uniref:UPF0182 protein ACFVKH_04215 n=1 Tax=Almyronema epifaneia S1 TaxID=2991925 RepID=A0ABW6ICK3_9CYAN